MTLRLHLPHHAPAGSAALESRPTREPPGLGARVFAVQRTGAVVLALFLLAFGLLGYASGQDFVSTRGQPVLGMSSNGLLSTLSVIVAIVLLAAVLRGPRTVSTVMIVLGALFLLSALGNWAAMQTRFNLLAFELSNVLFSVVVGLLLLVVGSYGRISGNLPPDSPYAHPRADVDYVDEAPHTPAEFAAERAMRAAEIAVVEHHATPEQASRVRAMADMRTQRDRRRVWMEFDDGPTTAPGASQRGTSEERTGARSRARRRA